MQKRKMDLNSLLAKYEQHPQHDSRLRELPSQPPIEEEFYQYRTYQERTQDDAPKRTREVSSTTQNFQGNFVMSKNQVEQFLIGIKGELRQEEKEIKQYGEVAIRQIHQNFLRIHDKLKKEILELLDRTFFQNERSIKQELTKQSKIQTPEFTAVFARIQRADEDINRLLNALKGSQYKKAIAEVVTRDFTMELKEVKIHTQQAKTTYVHRLGVIEPDRSRIQAIKENVLKIFYFKKNEPQPHIKLKPDDSGIFSIFKDKTQVQNIESQRQSRNRKSFFNFGE